MSRKLQVLPLSVNISTPWTHDVNWTYIRRSEDVQDVFWTFYVRSIYVLCPGGICIFQYEYFVLYSFVLYSMVLCNRFVFECFLPNIRLLLKTRFYKKSRSCETFTAINSVTRNSLIETFYKFKTITSWFTLHLHIYILG